jgi:hypothetical protein
VKNSPNSIGLGFADFSWAIASDFGDYGFTNVVVSPQSKKQIDRANRLEPELG